MGFREKVSNVLHATQRVFGEGEVVTYEPQGGSPYAVENVDGLQTSIFRRASVALDVETGLQVISADPEVTFAQDDLEAFPGEGDTVMIRGVRWLVVDPRDDGEGGVKVKLRRTT